MVCDVLRSLVGHQAHEGHLDADVLEVRSLVAILELWNLIRENVSVNALVNWLKSACGYWTTGLWPAHLESTSHGLTEPDMLLGVLAKVPVLHGNGVVSWVDASLTSLHIAEDLDGVQRRSLVGIHPVGA